MALQVATRLGYSAGVNPAEEEGTNDPENKANMIAETCNTPRGVCILDGFFQVSSLVELESAMLILGFKIKSASLSTVL